MDPSTHQRPNIALITLDQFRADCLGAAGHPMVSTPNLDRLASEGVRFTHHFSNCAPCAPGRASLLTGLWQMNHRVTSNGAPLGDDLPMLPRLLRELGYDPTLFGYTDTALDPSTLEPDDPRNDNWEEAMSGFTVGVMVDEGIESWTDWLAELGYEVPEQRTEIYEPAKVEVPENRGATWAPSIYAAEHTESAFVTDRALEWLTDAVTRPEPWCAHLSYLRPHPPYLAPHPYNEMFDPAEVPDPTRHPTAAEEAGTHPFLAGALTVVPSPEAELDQQQLQATYFGMIAEVDAALGRFLDGLDALGQRENTIVVVTSDHGEQLGDHWLIEKLGFFDQSYRIPLIIRWPQMAGDPGRSVDAFTENVDIVPTLMELAGAPAPQHCDGMSLVPFLNSQLAGEDAPDNWRDAVHVEFDFREPTSTIMEDIFGLRQDECVISVLRDRNGKYVHFAGDLPPLFFDLDEDPGELNNLAGNPEIAARLLNYAQRLLSLRMAHTDPRLANYRATSAGPIHRADPPRPHRLSS